MNQRFLLGCVVASLFIAKATYASIPNKDPHPSTFIGPTTSLGFTGPLTDTSAYTFAGEVASRDLRIAGTYGWLIKDYHHLKFTVEYLAQNLRFGYFNKNVNNWDQQSTLGGMYQFDIPGLRFYPELDISGYYALSANASLGTDTGTFVNSAGVVQTYSDVQGVAGTRAGGVSPGFSVSPWHGNRTGINLNYDNVRYATRYIPQPNARGFGGTVHINQMLMHDIELGVIAAVRKPFNNYEADLAWNNLHHYGIWQIKVAGSYTAGKAKLLNSYNVGLYINYFLDRCVDTTVAKEAHQEFFSWMARPAVYMPQVLEVTDNYATVS